MGKEESKASVEKLYASGYLLIEDISDLIETAADYKCERAISLPDYFTLFLGRRGSLPVPFAERGSSHPRWRGNPSTSRSYS